MTKHAGGADLPSFGTMLRRQRHAGGLTQEELAELAGISPRELRAIETDAVHRPHRPTVERLASALHLSGVDRERFVAMSRGRPLDPAASSGGTGSEGSHGAAGDLHHPAAAAVAVAGSSVAAGVPAVPGQLPADVAGFTGRKEELAVLDGLLVRQQDGERAVVISAVSGTAGVGKTALAVRWAHRMSHRFPDGQLYVNLRGYDPDQPVPPGAALAGFLRALGMPDAEIPLEEQERAAVYRTLLADGRRVLVVLDNAARPEQVRPLLPGSPGCLAVVTSRDSLAGLVARDGAHRIDVDLLPPEDAVALLRALIGERVDAEPEAATALAAHCARLPLALRIAAERAASRPTTSLSDLVAELWPPEGGRLTRFNAGGDPHTALAEVFSWSLRHLIPREVRAFHLLGLHPGPDHDLYAAAALLGSPLEEARHDLEALHRAHLIHIAGPSRYGMHDLLREFAVQLNDSQDADTPQPGTPRLPAAMRRLLDFYLAAAGSAMDTILPAEKDRRPRPPTTGTPIPDLSEPATARRWLNAERPVLVTLTGYAAVHGWHTHVIHLARTLRGDLEDHNTEALTMHGHARAAARACGARDEEASALNHLGHVHYLAGHYQDAIAYEQEALSISQRLDDRVNQARTLADLGRVYHARGNLSEAADHLLRAIAGFRDTGDQLREGRALNPLGRVHWLRGEYADAAACHEQAVVLARQTGDRISESRALIDLGLDHARQGRHEDARTQFRLALRLSRKIGYRYGEAAALDSMGLALAQQGHYRQAADYHETALAIARELGAPDGEADALNHLGDLDLRRGRPRDSNAHHRQALAIYRHIGNQAGEVAALNGLGEALLAAGNADTARAQHEPALHLATTLGVRYEQARAQAGLALVSEARGQTEAARDHWRRALRLYDALAVPEADLARQRLAALAATQPG